MRKPFYRLHWDDATEAECDKFITAHVRKETNKYISLYGYYSEIRFNYADYPDQLSCKRAACQAVARELNDYMG